MNKPCGAKTRAGGTCVNPPMTGATRWTTPRAADHTEALTCDNERSEAARCANTRRPLTHLSDGTGRQAAMQATRENPKTGIDPAPNAPIGLTDELLAIYNAWPQRFRSKVRLTAGCWLWTRSKDDDGYGRYNRGQGRGTTGAHRFALELTDGVSPPFGVSVDHLCRDHSCVRPDHLDPAGQPANVRRGATCNDGAGYCRRGLHSWTPENILIEAGGTRRCRPCRNRWDRDRRAR